MAVRGQAAPSGGQAGSESLGEATRGLTLRDPALRWLLVLACALQLFLLLTHRGYSEADVVEYAARAQRWVEGQELFRHGSARPFGYSALLAPFFLLARWLDVADARWAFTACRLVQITLALFAVLSVAQLAERLANRRTGLAAGWLLAINPVFLHHAIVPVPGVVAGLCLTRGALALWRSDARRSAWVGGLWMGASMMFSYQSLLVVGLASVLVVPAYLYRRQLRASSAYVAGVLVLVGCIFALDRAAYGVWGQSLVTYLALNAGYIVVRVLWVTHLRDASLRLYEWLNEFHAGVYEPWRITEETQQVQDTSWYLDNLTEVWPWPFLVLAGLAFARSLRRVLSWPTLLWILLIGSLLVMSQKGSKVLRLWLPLLPFAATLCAWGWDGLLEWMRARTPRFGGTLGYAVLPLLLVSTAPVLAGQFSQCHDRYWNAIDWIAEHRLEGENSERSEPLLIACHRSWMIRYRIPPGLEQRKLPHGLDSWRALDEKQLAAEKRALAELDYLLVHREGIFGQFDLLTQLGELFQVETVLQDEADFVLILRRATEGGRRFFRVREGPPIEELSHRGIVFQVGEVRLRLLEADIQPLPGVDLAWLHCVWSVEGPLERPVRIFSRFDTGELHNWQRPRYLAWGFYGVPAGSLLEEGYFVFPRDGSGLPTDADEPAALWMKLVQLLEGGKKARMDVYRAGEEQPLRASLERGSLETADGFAFTPDGMLRIGELPIDIAGTAPE